MASVLLESITLPDVQIADWAVQSVVGGSTMVIAPAGFSSESRSGTTVMVHSSLLPLETRLAFVMVPFVTEKAWSRSVT